MEARDPKLMEQLLVWAEEQKSQAVADEVYFEKEQSMATLVVAPRRGRIVAQTEPLPLSVPIISKN